jgi:hypothetical protein
VVQLPPQLKSGTMPSNRPIKLSVRSVTQLIASVRRTEKSGMQSEPKLSQQSLVGSIAASCLLLFMMASCATVHSGRQVMPIPLATKPSIPTTEAGCVAHKGNWSQQGLLGGPYRCDLKATDARKRCTDGSQCEGECLVDNTVALGARAVGSCSEFVATYGCHRFVRREVVQELCTD